MNYCSTCPRRHRPRRVKPLAVLPWETSPLGGWRLTPITAAVAKPACRVVLLHGCLNAEGEPRGGIVHPNGRTLAFHNLAAAAAALRQIEAPR